VAQQGRDSRSAVSRVAKGEFIGRDVVGLGIRAVERKEAREKGLKIGDGGSHEDLNVTNVNAWGVRKKRRGLLGGGLIGQGKEELSSIERSGTLGFKRKGW